MSVKPTRTVQELIDLLETVPREARNAMVAVSVDVLSVSPEEHRRVIADQLYEWVPDTDGTVIYLSAAGDWNQ